MTMNEIELKISAVCDDIKELLIHKNRKYGNSALQPNRIFSKCSATEQLLVRIDDKLNRIMKGAGLLATDEDVINDLIGYLVLLKIVTILCLLKFLHLGIYLILTHICTTAGFQIYLKS